MLTTVLPLTENRRDPLLRFAHSFVITLGRQPVVPALIAELKQNHRKQSRSTNAMTFRVKHDVAPPRCATSCARTRLGRSTTAQLNRQVALARVTVPAGTSLIAFRFENRETLPPASCPFCLPST